VKTVRFSQVVAKCGKPESYLVFVDPAKDRALQSVIKAQRVMTVFQEAVGTKTDRAEIGFHPGPGRQFLVFPKSLRTFADRKVVGIKYDLLHVAEVPKGKRATKPRPQKNPVRKTGEKALKPQRTPAAKPNVVAFKQSPPAEEEEDEAIAELKDRVRHAMAVLEEGKAVAAFNLLKRIVGD
jgi:hypothetical protein